MNSWKILIKLKSKNKEKPSSFMYMWQTLVSEKNSTFFGLWQPLWKLNQNKDLSLMFYPCAQPMQVRRIKFFLDLHKYLAN